MNTAPIQPDPSQSGLPDDRQVSLPLTYSQKAAILIALLKPDQVSQIFKQLELTDLKGLLKASLDIEALPKTKIAALVKEFEAECSNLAQQTNIREEVHNRIEANLQPKQFSQLLNRKQVTAQALRKLSLWELVTQLPDKDFLSFLQTENTYVAGFVLSKLPTAKVAAIINIIEEPSKSRFVAAMITKQPVHWMAVKKIEHVVTEHFQASFNTQDDSPSSASVAGVLSELDSSVSDDILERLSQNMPSDTFKSVKSLMFKFDDISLLAKEDRAILFDQIPVETAIAALNGADENLVASVLESLGQRTRRMYEAEIARAGTKDPNLIKTARKEISAQVVRLASSRTIKLPASEIAA